MKDQHESYIYCGWWSHIHAQTSDMYGSRVITIHNNPENMQLPSRFKHLRLQLADVDTQDVSKFFAPTYTFIEEARAANEGIGFPLFPVGPFGPSIM